MSKHEPVLGQKVNYHDEYDPKVLVHIDRTPARTRLKYHNFQGFDLWRLYEITALNPSGIPFDCLGTIKIPADSPFIVESKSLKLYLGSFAQTRVASREQLAATIRYDLEEILECELAVDLYGLDSPAFAVSTAPQGVSIDEPEGVKLDCYSHNAALLGKSPGLEVNQILHSDLVRTLCPVTGQPDHASVTIAYQGPIMAREALLAYLVSLRREPMFHEQCCELIFSDLYSTFKPHHLTVTCNFTRRGGIDINPVRSTDPIPDFRPDRCLRQ